MDVKMNEIHDKNATTNAVEMSKESLRVLTRRAERRW